MNMRRWTGPDSDNPFCGALEKARLAQHRRGTGHKPVLIDAEDGESVKKILENNDKPPRSRDLRDDGLDDADFNSIVPVVVTAKRGVRIKQHDLLFPRSLLAVLRRDLLLLLRRLLGSHASPRQQICFFSRRKQNDVVLLGLSADYSQEPQIPNGILGVNPSRDQRSMALRREFRKPTPDSSTAAVESWDRFGTGEANLTHWTTLESVYATGDQEETE
ncbi:hypothetical protein C8J56DRAFT_886506 [Mycena floridula]|nr:hypothetical protein C8J56DRAFT_886506 [Mycena floridula]